MNYQIYNVLIASQYRIYQYQKCKIKDEKSERGAGLSGVIGRDPRQKVVTKRSQQIVRHRIAVGSVNIMKSTNHVGTEWLT